MLALLLELLLVLVLVLVLVRHRGWDHCYHVFRGLLRMVASPTIAIAVHSGANTVPISISFPSNIEHSIPSDAVKSATITKGQNTRLPIAYFRCCVIRALEPSRTNHFSQRKREEALFKAFPADEEFTPEKRRKGKGREGKGREGTRPSATAPVTALRDCSWSEIRRRRRGDLSTASFSHWILIPS